MWISSFPCTIKKKKSNCPSLIEWSWNPCKNHLIIHVRVYFWALSNSIGPYFCLYASTTLFFLLYLIVSFGVRMCETSNLVLLFKIILAIQSPLKFHKNFKMDFLKMSLGQMYFSETTSTALPKLPPLPSLSYVYDLNIFFCSIPFLPNQRKDIFICLWCVSYVLLCLN